MTHWRTGTCIGLGRRAWPVVFCSVSPAKGRRNRSAGPPTRPLPIATSATLVRDLPGFRPGDPLLHSYSLAAAAALTKPWPKNEFVPPVQRRVSSGNSGCHAGGHRSGVAVRRTAAFSAAGPQFGWRSLISAATPVACGDAIDVPLTKTQRAPLDSTARPGKSASVSSSKKSHVPPSSVLVQAPITASCTVPVAAK